MSGCDTFDATRVKARVFRPIPLIGSYDMTLRRGGRQSTSRWMAPHLPAAGTAPAPCAGATSDLLQRLCSVHPVGLP
ncbi:hypothetical protein GCM10010469_06270 [Streptomyces labedae]|uniref:Uncharacterized protein n=2 Tax=Streptomyces TaxID=1883 RepID=A0ABQ2TXQ0_9ACTN|nr:hypothetical protein GCM10010265_57380 [Streptomyces griseoincarnatus]GGT52375.1 hypothetical protein GCM10010287_28130 [Streptomyces variabilis]